MKNRIIMIMAAIIYLLLSMVCLLPSCFMWLIVGEFKPNNTLFDWHFNLVQRLSKK